MYKKLHELMPGLGELDSKSAEYDRIVHEAVNSEPWAAYWLEHGVLPREMEDRMATSRDLDEPKPSQEELQAAWDAVSQTIEDEILNPLWARRLN